MSENLEGIEASEELLNARAAVMVDALRSEIGSLVDAMGKTRRTLGSFQIALKTTAGDLPAASDTLTGVCAATEAATHNILGIVENLLARDEAVAPEEEKIAAFAATEPGRAIESSAKVLAEARGQRNENLLELLSQLAFQDVVGQTLAKIVDLNVQIEQRIVGLLRLLNVSSSAIEKLNLSSSSLSRVQDADQGRMQQEAVDRMLREYEASKREPRHG